MFGVVWVAGTVLSVGPPQRTIESQIEMLLLWTQHKAELYLCLVLHVFPHGFFPFVVFRAGRSSLHLSSDLPIPCLQHQKEISTDEKTQKKPAGASMGKSVTGGVSSKVSEHGRVVSRGHRHRMVSGPGATVPVGNCNHFN